MNVVTHAVIYNAAQHKASELLQLLQDFHSDDGIGQLDALLIVSLMQFVGVEDSTCTLDEMLGGELQWTQMNEHQKYNSKMLEDFQDRFLKHAN